jgi:hypothetical protein
MCARSSRTAIEKSSMGSAATGCQLGSDAAELARHERRGRALAPATGTILETREWALFASDLSTDLARFAGLRRGARRISG